MVCLNHVICISALLICTANAKLIDLSYSMEEGQVDFPGNFPFKRDPGIARDADGNFFVAYADYKSSEHSGTHFDAFSHFTENGDSIEKMPVESFFLNAIVIDVSDKCLNNPNYTVEASDLDFTEKEIEVLKRNKRDNCLLVFTGQGRFWGDKLKYTGTESQDASKAIFPSFGGSAARKIVDLDAFTIVGLDSLSIDPAFSMEKITHRLFSKHGIYGLENAANLDQLPVHQFFRIFAFPMKLKGGTGSPTRVVARVMGK